MSLLYIKINLKWIIDLNVRARISKLSESVIEETVTPGKVIFICFFKKWHQKPNQEIIQIKLLHNIKNTCISKYIKNMKGKKLTGNNICQSYTQNYLYS